jgi:hypothetical protein
MDARAGIYRLFRIRFQARVPCGGFFLSCFNSYREGFGTLFPKSDGTEDEPLRGSSDPFGFAENFGWIQNAKMVSEFESISLDDVWNLSATQFLNDLTYLNIKQQFDEYKYKQGAGRGSR